MREQKQVEINGDTYLITQFPARKGIRIGKKVAKIILPAIGKMYGGDEKELNLGDMFEVIAENLDELDDKTIDELLSETTVNKYTIDADNLFAGNYGTLFLLLWEIIEFNFSSVFSTLTGDTED